jgi:glycosyltransferase involved in cell wall biosynthesis
MDKLTLIIPAKKEKESLPIVLDELKSYNCKIIIILEESDLETIQSINNYNHKIIYQKNKGYGDALIQGLNSVQTEYFCIFNADGSFNPNELKSMYDRLENNIVDIIFASRYESDCSSEDDTLVTYVGNFIFTTLGKILFNLNITDILYTFVMGKTNNAQNLKLKSKDFVFCVELPIKANKNKLRIETSKSNERARFAGKKKVNAIKDGFLILKGMFKLFFSN